MACLQKLILTAARPLVINLHFDCGTSRRLPYSLANGTAPPRAIRFAPACRSECDMRLTRIGLLLVLSLCWPGSAPAQDISEITARGARQGLINWARQHCGATVSEKYDGWLAAWTKGLPHRAGLAYRAAVAEGEKVAAARAAKWGAPNFCAALREEFAGILQ